MSNLRRLSLRQQDARIAWWLVIPSLIVILGVTLQPILSTLYLSLFEVSSGINQPQTFKWLGNYQELLSESTFWEAVARTLYFTVVSVGLEIIIGLALAELINAHPPGWQFLRVSLIIPWAFPTIVNGTMWKWIYSADFGALNGALYQLGIIQRYVPWLVDPIVALNFVILADLWHVIPFVALILQAALATLPVELDEAARVDGANLWQRFWYVQLPQLRPAILVALIVRTVDAFRVFDIVYIITGGGPAFGTVTISYLTYLETFSFGNLGRGAALSFLVSLITAVLAMVYIRVLYRPAEESQA